MGKSLQPQKAIAVRQPANTPAAAGPAAPGPNEPATAESLGWQLRAALPPLRLHSVSIYDEQANILWLSEGALGPDEHNVVVEAIDALGSDPTLNCYETGLEDGRVAIFLPVRAPQGGLVGLAMILADIKSVGDGVLERMVSPQVRTIMQKVAVLLRPAPARASQTASLKILELAPEADEAPEQAAPSKSATPVSNFSPAMSATRVAPATPAARPLPPVLSAKAVDDILEFELTPDLPSAAGGTRSHSQTQRLPALTAVNGVDLSLDLPTAKPAARSAPVAPTLSGAAAPTLGFVPTLGASSGNAAASATAARSNGASAANGLAASAFAPTPNANAPATAPVVTGPSAAARSNGASATNGLATSAFAVAPSVNAPAASSVHSSPLASLAESFDLELPELNPPVPTVFAGNVAQTTSTASAPISAVPAAVPTVAPATSTAVNGLAASPTVMAAEMARHR